MKIFIQSFSLFEKKKKKGLGVDRAASRVMQSQQGLAEASEQLVCQWNRHTSYSFQVLLHKRAGVSISSGAGTLFYLKGCAGRVAWNQVGTFLHARSTGENLEMCLHPKEALCFFCFRYCYMALILKFKSFILVWQIWKQKEERERKGNYIVFHMISVITITQLASSYLTDDSQC